MLFILRQSPVIRHIARTILEDTPHNSLCPMEKVVTGTTSKTSCDKCNELSNIERRLEIKISEIDKKVEGLKTFLTNV